MTASVSARHRMGAQNDPLLPDLEYVIHFSDGRIARCDYFAEAVEIVSEKRHPRKRRGDDGLSRSDSAARNERIFAAHRNGEPMARICARERVTESTVMRVCAALRKQGL